MADLAHYDRLEQAFDALLQDLLPAWPMEKDVAYVREEVGHGEYGDALENLIAVGLSNGVGFSSSQVQQVEALAVMMDMEASPWLARLREAWRQMGASR